MADLDLRLHARQGAALLSEAEEIVYGGAAGGGKSHLIRAAFLAFAGSVPGLQLRLFRRNYEELIANHMTGPGGFMEMLAPAVKRGHCEILTKEIRFSNGSNIKLGHLNHLKDLAKYHGQEFHVLGFDELTHFTDEMYRRLRGRLRLGGLKIPPGLRWKFPRILSGTNPGGIGHHWVKRDFVDPGAMKLHTASKADGGMTRMYIPARLEDNPTLTENDPGYEDRLEGLGDPMLVRALRSGDWNVVAGAIFGEVWREEKHVCDPFPIPKGWPIWRGMDDGFAACAAICWLTQDPDKGTVYVLDEIYKPKMLPDEIAERVKIKDSNIQLLGGYGIVETNQEPLDGILDSAAFADTGTQGSGGQKVETRGKQMNLLGLKWKPCAKPPGSRVQGAQNLSRLLMPNPRDPFGRPGIIFFRNCKNAIRTIPTLTRDPHNIEDCDSEGEDHFYDCLRYALQRKKGTSGMVQVMGT